MDSYSAQAVLDGTASRARPASASTSVALSAREREVLSCVVEGMHDREIADYLSISAGEPPFRAGDPAYARVGEIRWGGFIRTAL